MLRGATEPDGGYEPGYLVCPCFWGTGPGSIVKEFVRRVSPGGRRVLDAGAGEGKNAAFLTELGAEVVAVETSSAAIANGRREFGWIPSLTWVHQDINDFDLRHAEYDAVVAYGLFHCLSDGSAIRRLVRRLQLATKAGGWHVICVFNDRSHDLSAHRGFAPCLLGHTAYLSLYEGWHLEIATDRDLTESHPHNEIVHTHSMTRLLVRKPV